MLLNEANIFHLKEGQCQNGHTMVSLTVNISFKYPSGVLNIKGFLRNVFLGPIINCPDLMIFLMFFYVLLEEPFYHENLPSFLHFMCFEICSSAENTFSITCLFLFVNLCLLLIFLLACIYFEIWILGHWDCCDVASAQLHFIFFCKTGNSVNHKDYLLFATCAQKIFWKYLYKGWF